MSGERSSHGSSSDGSIHLHYSKKTHGHQTGSNHVDTSPEVYCIPRDGRLLVFKLESGTANAVGDFGKFTRKLQVWIPFRCESCELTQFMDMGVSYVDENDIDDQSVDSGKWRIFGGRFACPGCSNSIRLEVKFEYYASSARFSREASEGVKIIHLTGAREFFKSAKNASVSGYNTEATEQGSLMHFG